MSLYSRIIFYMYTFQLTTNTIVGIDQPQICPVIPISLDVPASQNRSNKFSRSCTLILSLAIRKNFITFLC